MHPLFAKCSRLLKYKKKRAFYIHSLTERLPVQVYKPNLSYASTFSTGFYHRKPGAETVQGNSNFPLVDFLFLRDSCQCNLCVDPATQQKKFQFAEIPLDISASVEIDDDGGMRLTWHNDIPGFDKHETYYVEKQLRDWEEHRGLALAMEHRTKPIAWDRSCMERSLNSASHSFDAFSCSTETLSKAVRNLLDYGIVFVRDVPPKSSSVGNIARRLGPVRNTFYGETWDVRSVADPKNVANTPGDLCFHQDLLYMANPPGIQLLHVIQSASQGGESLFADGAFAIDEIQRETPDVIRSLMEVPVTYQYRNDGEWYEWSRPALEGLVSSVKTMNSNTSMNAEAKTLIYGQDYTALNWSPPFQGPFHTNEVRRLSRDGQTRSKLTEYRKAAGALKRVFEKPGVAFETRLPEGTCVVFDNRRIVHARRAFQLSGGQERWLRGAYVDWDPVMSRWRTMGRWNNQSPANGLA